MSLDIALLHSSHKKKQFSCGVDQLDRYLINQASQDVSRKLSVCFVLLEKNTVKGYFTLSNNGIDRKILPDNIKIKLPQSYSKLPTTLLGRLAIDKTKQKQGVGELLLLDALRKSYYASKEMGSIAVIVDPINDSAFAFYKNYGFILLPDSNKMFISMKTIEVLFNGWRSMQPQKIAEIHP